MEAAFRAVPRHRFLPGASAAQAYTDRAVVTSRDAGGLAVSSSSQPSLMAEMLGQLAVEPGMAVLEIGTGTGYNAALLGRLARTVVTVDIDPSVTGPAGRHLAAAGASNVSVVTGDGWAPLPGGGSFDRIVVTVGAWDVSPAWVDQLAPGGVLVVPLWLRAGQQASIAFEQAGAGLRSRSVVPCGFMRMRGPGAGKPSYVGLGPWTVSLDRPDPARVAALAAVLDAEPTVRPAPALEPGWFAAIALGADDAIHLFREGDGAPVIRQGVLQTSPPGLAVVESAPPEADVVRAFGSPGAWDRLVDLLARRRPVDLSALTVAAVPDGDAVEDGGRWLARLVRPQFTYLIGAAG